MCRWFAYISGSEPCLLQDVLITPEHALVKQVNDHYLPGLFSFDPAVHAEIIKKVKEHKQASLKGEDANGHAKKITGDNPVGVLSHEKIVHSKLITEQGVIDPNYLLNTDGCGLVWYTSTKSAYSPKSTGPDPKAVLYPALYKSVQPPLNNANFNSICNNTESKVVFAHIRAASPGGSITPVNNHPFVFGIHTIMHNGYISNFEHVKLKMCNLMSPEAYGHILGSTDTEHLAALFMTYLCKSKAGWESYHTASDLAGALQKTITTIITLQSTTPTITDPKPNALNICITDGRSLVACRFLDDPIKQPLSLYYSTTAGSTLNHKFPDHADGVNSPYGAAGNEGEGNNPHATKEKDEHGSHVVVSSEPNTYKVEEWNLIMKNHVVLTDAGKDVRVEALSYPAGDAN